MSANVSCPGCGQGEYSAWDGDGWMREFVVIDHDKLDVDCSGIVDECSRCECELTVVGQRVRVLERGEHLDWGEDADTPN